MNNDISVRYGMSTNKVIIINSHCQWSGDVDVGGSFFL